MCLSTRFANEDNRTAKGLQSPTFPVLLLPPQTPTPFTSLSCQGSQESERERFIIESGPLGREVQVPNEEKEGYALKTWTGEGLVSLSLFCTQRHVLVKFAASDVSLL